MADFWSLLSVNDDLEGLEFVSTLEANNYPFTATQVSGGREGGTRGRGVNWRPEPVLVDLGLTMFLVLPKLLELMLFLVLSKLLGLILFLVVTKLL